MNAGRTAIESFLRTAQHVAPVLPRDLPKDRFTVLDFSAGNPDLTSIDTGDVTQFTAYVAGVLETKGAAVGVGRYGEERVIYRHSALFRGRDHVSTEDIEYLLPYLLAHRLELTPGADEPETIIRAGAEQPLEALSRGTIR